MQLAKLFPGKMYAVQGIYVVEGAGSFWQGFI